jgi:hypothetical protein
LATRISNSFPTLQQEYIILFKLLKKEIAAAMKLTYPGMNPEVSEWKGQEITDFQEDLLKKVNGRLSEKWFYTHMKASGISLPRIDVLNMLSKYAGYSNWDDFRFKKSAQVPIPEKLKKANNIFIKIPVLVVFTVILLYAAYRIINTQKYHFTFIDSETGEPIQNSNIMVDLLLKDESPLSYKCDDDGSLVLRTDQSKIKMIVRAPYYSPDTVQRILKKFNHLEQIKLHIDPYALMIHYFSQTDVKGWQNRREQLDRIFNEGAIIYQVPDKMGVAGMELYNKREFIDKLTMPTTSLRQIEILDTRYDRGQIVLLRFKVKLDKK